MEKTAALISDMVDLLPTLGASLKRRKFITMLCGTAAAWPFVGRAQQNATGGRMSKIGLLWHAGSRAEEGVYFDVLMKAFGEDRLVWGSNWPVCEQGGDIGNQIAIAEEYLSSYGPEVRDKVMFKNAQSFYRRH